MIRDSGAIMIKKATFTSNRQSERRQSTVNLFK